LAPDVDSVGRRVHRKKIFFLQLVGFAVAISAAACAQEPSLARLNRDTEADIPRASITNTWTPPHSTRTHVTSGAAPASRLARTAAQALFVRSDVNQARAVAALALRRNPTDVEALFVRMEVAAMEHDDAALLDAAISLCEAGENKSTDPRVQLAEVRIREAAANTPAFRAVIARIKALLANSQEPRPVLQEALLNGAMDGAPRLNPYADSRAAGILTDWRIVGPVGGRLNGSDNGISPAGDLSAAVYQNRLVENFQFPDGKIVLPGYLSHHGTFYGATHFASLTAATWRVDVDGSGGTEVYVDGRRVLRSGGREGHYYETFEASPGPHRVMVEFAASAEPLRVAITPARNETHPALPSRDSLQELTYLLAATHYAGGDFDSAAKQIEAVPSAENSAALQFLLRESQGQDRGNGLHGMGAETEVNSLASAAPATNEWVRRIAMHPSCDTLLGAEKFYRGQGDLATAAAIQQKLDGCAPESLDYAKSLSDQGKHHESIQALRRLVSAAPLNRNARLMLVRELQFDGEDEAAERAAVEWLRMAPNAGDYHRLAAAGEPGGDAAMDGDLTEAFYAPYRRDVSEIVRESALRSPTNGLLLEDHVAIARADGSVSLYVHTANRPLPDETLQQAENATLQQGAQVLGLRVIHADGSSTSMNDIDRRSVALTPGDAVEEEYLIHYAGDGGISEHCEAFQFVFRNGDEQPLHARFVVLTPAKQSDRGVVIATGGAPEMTTFVHEGMLQRVWDNEKPEIKTTKPGQLNAGSPIVRVVDEENGWATPSSAEHQRRIETIHPGPRPEES
jgi:tetratricopeptide (TPR) repeat protein